MSNQLEGGFVQATTLTRMGLPAALETVLLNRPELPFSGSGEASQNPTPAAIANAVYDAVGIRLREIPFTQERVLGAL